FTQDERTLDRSKGGLGIGLTLVQRLLELHGGSITATSTLGQGSEFTIRLPLAKPSQNSAEPAGTNEHSTPTSPQGRKLLVVDDNVDAAESLARMLSKAGYDVSTAYDGRQAIKEAIFQKPHA